MSNPQFAVFWCLWNQLQVNTLLGSLAISCSLSVTHPACAQTVADQYSRFERGVTAVSEHDYETALSLFRPLAGEGYSNAQWYLGSMYSEGNGVPQDDVEAVRWWRECAANGQAICEQSLGDSYETGAGVPKDPAQAEIWFRKAAEQGDDLALASLGEMYERGAGHQHDNVKAYMWFYLATAVRPSWTNSMARLGARMTASQISNATNLAIQCQQRGLKGCGAPTEHSTAVASVHTSPDQIVVPLAYERGAYVVGVLINNAITLKFVVDTGATDVAIPADVVSTLMRMGALSQADFRGTQTYVLADGSRVPSQTFNIRALKVGRVVLNDVIASVSPARGALLLGQSFLKRFRSWSIDNNRHTLVLQ